MEERRMLIVEDEGDVCECLGEFFKGHGFAVESVFSGEEALAKLSSEDPPDILLLDILLPGVSGIEVLMRAKTLYPSTQVVIVSAVDDTTVRLQAYHYGASAYITKPFDFSPKTWSAVLS